MRGSDRQHQMAADISPSADFTRSVGARRALAALLTVVTRTPARGVRKARVEVGVRMLRENGDCSECMMLMYISPRITVRNSNL